MATPVPSLPPSADATLDEEVYGVFVELATQGGVGKGDQLAAFMRREGLIDPCVHEVPGGLVVVHGDMAVASRVHADNIVCSFTHGRLYDEISDLFGSTVVVGEYVDLRRPYGPEGI